MLSNEAEQKLAQANLRNVLDNTLDLLDGELLEVIQEAFPTRSCIDHLGMMFKIREIQKKKLSLVQKYDLLTGIGHPCPNARKYINDTPDQEKKDDGKKERKGSKKKPKK